VPAVERWQGQWATEEDTQAFARRLATTPAIAHATLTLQGDLGAGKTTLVRKAGAHLPQPDLRIALAVVGEARRARLSAGSEGGRACLSRLSVAAEGRPPAT
jgi:type II secretory pathway predicted ATPase ExeA